MPETILRQGDGGQLSTTLSINTDDPLTVHMALMVLEIQDVARAGTGRGRKPTEMRAALTRVLLLCDDALAGPGAAERRRTPGPTDWVAEWRAGMPERAAGAETAEKDEEGATGG